MSHPLLGKAKQISKGKKPETSLGGQRCVHGSGGGGCVSVLGRAEDTMAAVWFVTLGSLGIAV